MEETSDEILSLLGIFKKQWDEFLKRLEGMGKRIGDLQKDFETLSGVRRRQLERPLNRIEEIRNERGLPPRKSQAQKKTKALTRPDAIVPKRRAGLRIP